MNRIDLTKLKISSYFENLINDLDIHIESIKLEVKSTSELEKLDFLQNSLIKEINSVKDFNIVWYEKSNKISINNQLDFNDCEPSEQFIKEWFKNCCYFIFKHLELNVPLYRHGILLVTDITFKKDILRLIEELYSNETIESFHRNLEHFSRHRFDDFMRDQINEFELSETLITAMNIFQKYKSDMHNPILRVATKPKEPFKIENITLSSIEVSLFDKLPITGLENVMLKDLSLLNDACLVDNYILKTLIIYYLYKERTRKPPFSNLNLDRFKGLKKLSLTKSGCNWKDLVKYTIPENIFQNLGSLEELKINDNQIKELHENQFISLKNLKSLSINKIILNNKNSILEFFYSFLSFKPKINQNNMLNKLLRGLENLRVLEVKNSNLVLNDLFCINNLSVLEELDLSRNHIKIDKSFYRHRHGIQELLKLTKLKKLDLSCNLIKCVKAVLFDNITNLEHLCLNTNPIESLEDCTFTKLKHLRKLDLECLNKFHKTNKLSFKGLESLEELYLDSQCNYPYNIKSLAKCLELKTLSISFMCMIKNKKHNHSIELSNDTFKGLIKLEKLFLKIEFKFFQNIKNNIFNDLKDLRQLEFKIINREWSVPDSLILNSSNLNISAQLMTTLSLPCSRITKLGDNIFDNMTNLEYLDLTVNSLKEIDGVKLFKNLSKLKKLFLKFNEISYISPNSFDNLINLTLLDLSGNRIEMLDKNIFSNLKKLKYLDLLENRNFEIKSEYFENLHSLTQLGLTGNFTELKGLFKTTTNLRTLSIYFSNLNYIPEYLFSNLTYLHKLSLRACRISKIHQDAFENLSFLKELSLMMNQIEYLENDLFKNLNSLRILDLGFNELKDFDLKIIENLTKLEEVRLGKNRDLKIELNDERHKEIIFLD